MDTYQAVYDAVRSRISCGNISDTVERVLRDSFDISNQRAYVAEAFVSVAHSAEQPSVLMRPRLSIDGTMWCALYGEDLQVGVAGFGETPAAAMAAFDLAWRTERTPAARRSNP